MDKFQQQIADYAVELSWLVRSAYETNALSERMMQQAAEVLEQLVEAKELPEVPEAVQEYILSLLPLAMDRAAHEAKVAAGTQRSKLDKLARDLDDFDPAGNSMPKTKTGIVDRHLHDHPDDIDEDPHHVRANIHAHYQELRGDDFDEKAMPGYELVRKIQRQHRQ